MILVFDYKILGIMSVCRPLVYILCLYTLYFCLCDSMGLCELSINC